ncbi:hypothetical protein N7495_006230 [Penicillium taxi]|uniref:uncharacterized protein n=1 Tax=Penicillium taxi TaxID=168475 RepID=UPI002544ECC6|nr:uncharacterized protein N7495_006230 [Penicillium taxi]KAJ5894539.1 hypothetical protein N7495_006230 [Penicillium taxi]
MIRPLKPPFIPGSGYSQDLHISAQTHTISFGIFQIWNANKSNLRGWFWIYATERINHIEEAMANEI